MSINEDREKVKKKVQAWLLEEGFKVSTFSNERAYFNFLAENKDGRKVNVFQPMKTKDHIVIATGAILTDTQKNKLMKMEDEHRNQFLWTLRFGLLGQRVSFSGIRTPLESIDISNILYYDALTKDNFMNRLFEVRKTLLFIMWTLDRELGELEPTSKPSYIG